MIRVLRKIGGRTDGHEMLVGTVHSMNPVIEEQLVRQEYAEYIVEPKPERAAKPVIETAEVAPPRNAAKRTTKPAPRNR